MGIQIRTMTTADYELVIKLWSTTEGIGLSTADSQSAIERYLTHNLGCSFTAWDGDRLVGAVLAGHDYRRGYLHHLAVEQEYRGKGIGTDLVEHCLSQLKQAGIEKCHLFVFRNNEPARTFWAKVGWQERVELILMSKTV